MLWGAIWAIVVCQVLRGACGVRQASQQMSTIPAPLSLSPWRSVCLLYFKCYLSLICWVLNGTQWYILGFIFNPVRFFFFFFFLYSWHEWTECFSKSNFIFLSQFVEVKDKFWKLFASFHSDFQDWISLKVKKVAALPITGNRENGFSAKRVIDNDATHLPFITPNSLKMLPHSILIATL